MKKLPIALFFGLTVAFTGCYYYGPCLNGSGPVTSEFREVTIFNGIHNTGSFSVYVAKDEDYSVEVVAQENLLPIIETYVSGYTLTVKTRNGTCFRTNSPVEVYVTLPELDYLKLSGSGRLEADVASGQVVECSNSGSGYLRLDTAVTPQFEAGNSGSGTVQLEEIYAGEVTLDNSGSGTVDGGIVFGPEHLSIRHSSSGRIRASVEVAAAVDAMLSGSGRVELYGDAAVAEYRLTSSGRIDALELVTSEVEATTTGSGKIFLYATDYLDATITGSGDIIYRGNPEIRVRITGSGRLHPY